MRRSRELVFFQAITRDRFFRPKERKEHTSAAGESCRIGLERVDFFTVKEGDFRSKRLGEETESFKLDSYEGGGGKKLRIFLGKTSSAVRCSEDQDGPKSSLKKGEKATWGSVTETISPNGGEGFKKVRKKGGVAKG